MDGNTEDLKTMVQNFRVHELQQLLGFANRNRFGKKNDLLTRALELVSSTRSLPIQMKVRELYRKRYPPSTIPVNGFAPHTPSIVQTPAVAASTLSTSSSPHDPSTQSRFFAPFLSNPTLPKPQPQQAQQQQRPAAPTPVFMNSPPPVHPSVSFVRLPFYDHMADLLQATTLAPRTNQRFQEQFLLFSLNAQQIHDISYPETMALPRVEVQLRFCLLDLSGPQKDDFPPSCVVRLNDKLVSLPNPIPTNKPGVEPKRPSRPVNITPYCLRTAAKPQRLNVTWSAPQGSSQQCYVVSVVLVRRVNTTILLQRLKMKGVQSPDITKRMIRAKVAEDDNDIAATSVRVSLLCPLGKMRMVVPAKVNSCDHMQCFDANLYLAMNEKKPTWSCPVCDKSAHYDDLVIDGYMSEVLTQTCDDVVDIEVHEDATWTSLVRDEDNKLVAAASQSHKVAASKGNAGNSSNTWAEVLDVSDDLRSKELASAPSKSSSGNNHTVAHLDEIDVIDLISDDDDDENQRQQAQSVQTTRASTPCTQSGSQSSSAPSTSVTPSPATNASSPGVIVLDSPYARSPLNTPDDPLSLRQETACSPESVDQFQETARVAAPYSGRLLESPTNLDDARDGGHYLSSNSSLGAGSSSLLSPPKKRVALNLLRDRERQPQSVSPHVSQALQQFAHANAQIRSDVTAGSFAGSFMPSTMDTFAQQLSSFGMPTPDYRSFLTQGQLATPFHLPPSSAVVGQTPMFPYSASPYALGGHFAAHPSFGVGQTFRHDVSAQPFGVAGPSAYGRFGVDGPAVGDLPMLENQVQNELQEFLNKCIDDSR